MDKSLREMQENTFHKLIELESQVNMKMTEKQFKDRLSMEMDKVKKLFKETMDQKFMKSSNV